MLFLRRVLPGIFIALCVCAPARALDRNRVDSALQKAKDYLYSKQSNDNWEQTIPGDYSESHGDQRTGYTALAVYALLAAGESHQDERIAKAVAYLKTHETTGVYALGLRCQVWLLLPQTPDVKQAMAKDAKILRDSIKMEGEAAGFYAYNPDLKPFSHSRGQYGVLGMWAAAQSGVEVPDGYWRLVEQAWIDDQDPSGGWSYYAQPRETHPVTPHMTAAGIATLFITQDYLHANEGVGCRGNLRNPHIEKGLKWLTDNFDKVATDERFERQYPYSTNYAIERVGVASGYKYFNNIDWYERCGGWLLGKQKRDGSWPSEFGNVPSTCFSILFLARGRAPIAISKLDYSVATARKQAPWNQRPRDIANLARFIGRQSERDLNWQIVTLQAKIEDFHDAPILYLSGNEAIILPDEAKAKIRQFIEQGGLVLGNADCAGREFSISFRKLGQELFPKYEFRELPAEHPIYTNQQFPRTKWKAKPSILGLSNGARELMLLIPQADPAKAWQLQLVSGRDEHWQLASNIFLYAIDKQNLRTKGETYQISRNNSIKPAQTVKIARLQYDGNWDPEPGGWRRFANLMHNRHKVDIEVQAVDLNSGSLAGFRVAHLTGTTKFALGPQARDAIIKFVKDGGMLVIDSAGGSSDFAQSAESELAAIFPDSKLSLLPPEHPLFSEGSKIKSVAYRPFSSRVLGSLKDAPRIQSIELSGRAAVLFSREDLSVGLVGQPLDGVTGYEPATANEIMSRIILHSLASASKATKK